MVEPDGSLASYLNNVPFGGAYWRYVSFCFVDGVVSEVCFLTDENRSAVSIDNSFNELTISLDNKYKQYKLNTNSPEKNLVAIQMLKRLSNL